MQGKKSNIREVNLFVERQVSLYIVYIENIVRDTQEDFAIQILACIDCRCIVILFSIVCIPKV